MNAIKLKFHTVDSAGFGPDTFIGVFDFFDADKFCEKNNINRAELDADDVHAAQSCAAQLSEGEWMQVSYEIAQ